MNIYVGNFSFDTSEDDLRGYFEAYGSVESVKLISDRDTGRSKGFGFVEMENKSEALKAIKELDKTEKNGRTITVNESRPRENQDNRRSKNNHNFY
ncbi:MAG: RNA-binding protein [Acidobacteria bacterium]|nr:RNA-binding protein [Acidobacteriota bacterium]